MIAAVATGNLLTWDHQVTEDFDGWNKVSIAARGEEATFSYDHLGGRATLRWNRAVGFSTPDLS